MLNFILPLMKNPLTRIIADKTVSAINHSIEKKKVIRAKEIEAEQNVSIEQIKSSKYSLKFIQSFTTLLNEGIWFS